MLIIYKLVCWKRPVAVLSRCCCTAVHNAVVVVVVVDAAAVVVAAVEPLLQVT
jgi:hypothetical protein